MMSLGRVSMLIKIIFADSLLQFLEHTKGLVLPSLSESINWLTYFSADVMCEQLTASQLAIHTCPSG